MTRLTSVFTTTCFMLAGTVALCADKPSEWDARRRVIHAGRRTMLAGHAIKRTKRTNDRRASPAADRDKLDGRRESHSRPAARILAAEIVPPPISVVMGHRINAQRIAASVATATKIRRLAPVLAPTSAAILAIATAARETAMLMKTTTARKGRREASAVVSISDIIRTVAARATAMAMPTRMTTVRRRASAVTRVFTVRKTATRTTTMARRIALTSIADQVAMDLLVGLKASAVAPISAIVSAVLDRADGDADEDDEVLRVRRRVSVATLASATIQRVLARARATATPTMMTTALKLRHRALAVTTASTVRKTVIRMTIKMGHRIDAISIADRIATVLPVRRRASIITTVFTGRGTRMTTTIKTAHRIDVNSIAGRIRTTHECRSDYSAPLVIPA